MLTALNLSSSDSFSLHLLDVEFPKSNPGALMLAAKREGVGVSAYVSCVHTGTPFRASQRSRGGHPLSIQARISSRRQRTLRASRTAPGNRPLASSFQTCRTDTDNAAATSFAVQSSFSILQPFSHTTDYSAVGTKACRSMELIRAEGVDERKQRSHPGESRQNYSQIVTPVLTSALTALTHIDATRSLCVLRALRSARKGRDLAFLVVRKVLRRYGTS